MRSSLRLLGPLLGALLGVSAAFAFYQVSTEQRSLRTEFERRVATLAEGLVETVRPLLAKNAESDLRRIVQRNSNQERLLGMAIYDDEGRRVAATDIERLTQPFDAFAWFSSIRRASGRSRARGRQAAVLVRAAGLRGPAAARRGGRRLRRERDRGAGPADHARHDTAHGRRGAGAHRRRADRAGRASRARSSTRRRGSGR